MDNFENPESNLETKQWIEESTAVLAPPDDWEPDLRAAQARFAARVEQRSLRRYRLVGISIAGATAIVLVAIFIALIPPARVLAQQAGSNGRYRVDQIWNWISIVTRGPVLLIPLDLPVRMHPVRETGAPQVVADAAGAARLAGFDPHLPHSELTGKPRLSVAAPATFETVIRRADLEQALRSAQVVDQEVPRIWDGAHITLQMGAAITAEWSNIADEWSDLILAQCAPPVVDAPNGFNLVLLNEINLRAARMRNSHAAFAFAQYDTTAPALMLSKATHKLAGVSGISLERGDATLIEEFADLHDLDPWFGPKIERITLLWSTPDRMYLLSGRMKIPRAMTGIDLAGALTRAIELANSID